MTDITPTQREAYARLVEGDSDNPLRVAAANAILEGQRDDEVRTYLNHNALEVTTIVLTSTEMPAGNWWEKDGACWSGETDPCSPVGWRWKPMNWEAFGKEGPTSEMTDHIPFGGFSK